MLLYFTKPYSTYKINFLRINWYINRLKCWIVSFSVYLNFDSLLNTTLCNATPSNNSCIFNFSFSNPCCYPTDSKATGIRWSSPILFLQFIPEALCLGLRVKKIKGFSRIGPHNIDILSIIFGSLLGKGEAEKRKDGTCIIFNYKGMHLKYSLTLQNFLYLRGYCSPYTPTISKQLVKKSRIYKTVRFTTWNYTSFDWIYDLWYKNNVKTVPRTISEFLTPLALAIWVMDSGVKVPLGLSFDKSFTFSECELLVGALDRNFDLKAIIYNKGIPSQYCIYIPKESMFCLRNNIGKYVIPTMRYKILD